MPLLLLGLLACSAPGTEGVRSSPRDTPAASPDGVLDGTLGLEAFEGDHGPADFGIDDLEITPADGMGTVLVATFRTDRPCTGSVVFGLDGEPSLRATEPEEGYRHRLLLLGMPADAAVGALVACAEADGTGPVALAAARTAPLPEGIPNLAFSGVTDADSGFYTVPLMETFEVATIVDRFGRVVWGWVEQPGSRGSRVRVSVDGTAVLYNVQDQHPGGPDGSGAIVRVALDGSEVQTVPVYGQNHDFLELADGTLVSLAVDVRMEDGQTWSGDRVVEIAPDGTQREVWSAWDTWTVAGAPPVNDLSGGDSWTHANSIDYDADTDSYWIGIRNLSAIIRVDRATGEVLDQIGGPTPTWTFADGATPFDGQHQFEFKGDSLLLFDNQYASGASRAVQYRLDATTRTLTQAWAIAPETTWFGQAYGDVQRSGNGGVRVTWSTDGRIQGFDNAGAAQWQFEAPPQVWIGYSQRLFLFP